MKIHLHSFFLGLLCMSLYAANPEQGVPGEQMPVTIGQESSARGAEIQQQHLSMENGILLGDALRESADQTTDPLSNTGSFLDDESARPMKNLTITESATGKSGDGPLFMGENSAYSEAMKALDQDLDSQFATSSEKADLWLIPATFIIEFIILFTALSCGLQIVRSPTGSGRLLLLSAIVACPGILVDLALGPDPANPVRAAVGGIVLLALIKPLTELRRWGPAVKIAVATGVINFALLWGLATAVNAGFDL